MSPNNALKQYIPDLECLECSVSGKIFYLGSGVFECENCGGQFKLEWV